MRGCVGIEGGVRRGLCGGECMRRGSDEERVNGDWERKSEEGEV